MRESRPSVAQRTRQAHIAGVSKTLTAFLALLALLLMPFGMQESAAAASPAGHVAAEGHCDGNGGEEGATPSKVAQHCGTCMAVPVADVPQAVLDPLPRAPRSMASVTVFPGLEPEVSTPPPRRA